MSFVLGLGPFGSVYLMPVFLALVRGYNALKSGAIMLVRLASFKPNRKGSHRDADSARSVFAESLF
jgi:hypothetical protein